MGDLVFKNRSHKIHKELWEYIFNVENGNLISLTEKVWSDMSPVWCLNYLISIVLNW